eukprot:SAG11_NODE_3071_length_2713_cov_16.731446_1_plen_251_part_00
MLPTVMAVDALNALRWSGDRCVLRLSNTPCRLARQFSLWGLVRSRPGIELCRGGERSVAQVRSRLCAGLGRCRPLRCTTVVAQEGETVLHRGAEHSGCTGGRNCVAQGGETDPPAQAAAQRPPPARSAARTGCGTSTCSTPRTGAPRPQAPVASCTMQGTAAVRTVPDGAARSSARRPGRGAAERRRPDRRTDDDMLGCAVDALVVGCGGGGGGDGPVVVFSPANGGQAAGGQPTIWADGAVAAAAVASS